jgi:hypothetical protein
MKHGAQNMVMEEKNKMMVKVFSGLSLVGLLFVLTETILHLLGTSICAAEGCTLVAGSTRFGDISILLIGLSLFSLLAVLGIMSIYRAGPGLENAVDLVLIVSLASEGFFTGYQAFRLHAACLFCLIVFGFLVLLAGLRLIQGRKAVIAGFASLAAVFSLFYLVLPVDGTVAIPSGKQFLLFYGEDCKYCTEVIKEFEEKQIPVQHVPVKEYSGFLKRMGIEHVPTLFVNKNNEKIFLTGKEAILSYINCAEDKAAQGHVEKEQLRKKGSSPGQQNSQINPFDPAGRTGQSQSFELVPLAPSDEGICKPEQKCD